MKEEKRRQSRKEFSEPISVESMITGESRRSTVCRNGASLDISDGGLCLVTPHKWTVGEVVKLSLPLKGLDVTVPVFAEVLWVKPFEERYVAGLRFLS